MDKRQERIDSDREIERVAALAGVESSTLKRQRDAELPTFSTEEWLAFQRKEGAKLLALGPEGWRLMAAILLKNAKSEYDAVITLADMHFTLGWAECGFPQVVIADKLFAAFAGTWVSKEFEIDLKLPWDCFVVRVPRRFKVAISFDSGSSEPISHVVVRRNPDDAAARYRMDVEPEGDIVGGHIIHFDTFYELMQPVGVEGCIVMRDPDEPGNVPCVDVEEMAALNVLKRVVGCALIELMSPKHSATIGWERCLRERRARSGAKPKSWTFQLTRDVPVDFRDEIEAAMKGERGPSAQAFLQRMVRGHWKRQPCGKGGKERRYQHIEPYWRGPDDAPIAVRSHVLTKSDAAE